MNEFISSNEASTKDQQHQKETEDKSTESREEIEMTRRQLHQVQEEMVGLFHQDQAKKKELKTITKQMIECQNQLEVAKTQELQARQLLESSQSNVIDFEQKLIDFKASNSSTQIELQSALEQLRQVEDELQKYFLLAKEQSLLLNKHNEQKVRMQTLLSKVYRTSAKKT